MFKVGDELYYLTWNKPGDIFYTVTKVRSDGMIKVGWPDEAGGIEESSTWYSPREFSLRRVSNSERVYMRRVKCLKSEIKCV